MSAPFTTRPFLPTDCPAVLALWQSVEGVEVAEGDSPGEIAAYLQRNPGLSRVAEVDGRIAGALLCGHDGRRGFLYHLAVAPTDRGGGIGRQLVLECLEGLKTAGLKRALLLVEQLNEPGRAFWLSQGFEPIEGAIPLGRDLL